jgi:hypothetical protein
MQSMMNFPFYYNGQYNVQSDFNPNFFMHVQSIQDLLDGSDYPVFKHQKVEAPQNNTNFVDPDVFFSKEVGFGEEDFQSSYPTTDVCSSFALSPSRDYLSNFSEILTPDQNTPEYERKVFEAVPRDEQEEDVQEEPKTTAQLAKMIANKLSSDNSRLLTAIEQALQGQVSAVDFSGLTSLEAAVVNAILQKKDVGQANKKQKGKKREEEKQKFFFKGVLKFTESKFFGTDSTQKKRTKKKALKREAYYEYYWGEVAKENNIDLSNFFHPNKRLSSGKTTAQISSAHNPGLKSLNTTYIDLILSSDKFRADTIDYLNTVFLQETRNSRGKKINKLLTKLNSLASEASSKAASMPVDEQLEMIKNGIQEYLVYNPKSKLPWADSEIQEARDFAYNTILRQSSNKAMKYGL